MCTQQKNFGRGGGRGISVGCCGSIDGHLLAFSLKVLLHVVVVVFVCVFLLDQRRPTRMRKTKTQLATRTWQSSGEEAA